MLLFNKTTKEKGGPRRAVAELGHPPLSLFHPGSVQSARRMQITTQRSTVSAPSDRGDVMRTYSPVVPRLAAASQTANRNELLGRGAHSKGNIATTGIPVSGNNTYCTPRNCTDFYYLDTRKKRTRIEFAPVELFKPAVPSSIPASCKFSPLCFQTYPRCLVRCSPTWSGAATAGRGTPWMTKEPYRSPWTSSPCSDWITMKILCMTTSLGERA